MTQKQTARFHLPGLFEFYDFYKIFLPLFYSHKEWFYDWCEIGSIYGAPGDCLWGGGRAGYGQNGIERDVLDLTKDFGISARLAFSNSLLKKEHLGDKKCNHLSELFCSPENGIIIHSDLLLEYLKTHFPHFYFVSSTTKVLTEWNDFEEELKRPEFAYVVPDFRLNTAKELFSNEKAFSIESYKGKIEFLCNECCSFTCKTRKMCYKNVSKLCLGIQTEEWKCSSENASEGYKFSNAMKNPAFIGLSHIQEKYLPAGYTNFKIEGRSLGSALLLEFILYYMTKPEHQIQVREEIYLDNTLDLF